MNSLAEKVKLIYPKYYIWGENKVIIVKDNRYIVLYKNDRGNIITSKEYDDILTIQKEEDNDDTISDEGQFTMVGKDGKWGLIDKSVNEILKTKYLDIKCARQGVIIAATNKNIVMYDYKGNEIKSVSKSGYIGIVRNKNNEEFIMTREESGGQCSILTLEGKKTLVTSKEGTGLILCGNYIVETSIIAAEEKSANIHATKRDKHYKVYNLDGSLNAEFTSAGGELCLRYEWDEEEMKQEQKQKNGRYKEVMQVVMRRRILYGIIIGSGELKEKTKIGKIVNRQGDRMGKSFIDILDIQKIYKVHEVGYQGIRIED